MLSVAISITGCIPVRVNFNELLIIKSLEIGEGYAPNIFSCINNQPEDKTPGVVSNPHQLNSEEMMELADFNIQLWMDLKSNIRKYGVESSKIFNRDTGHCRILISAL
jgi:hypothetical protein